MLPPPTGGVGFFIDGEENEFIIYSDPGSPIPLPPIVGIDDNMRPPESSPAPTPIKQRKRRSSGAVVDSDEDNNTESQDDAELAAGRGEKKRKAKAVKVREKVRLMPTSALMDLLPRRKRNTRVELLDEFDILSTSEENREEEDDEEDTGKNGSVDELSKPLGRTRGGGTKKPATKGKGKGKGKTPAATSGKGISAKEKGKGKTIAPAAVTKNTWSKPLSGRTGKTYARRSIGSEKENDSPNKVRGSRDQGNDGNGSDASVVADRIVEKTGRKKLEAVVEKFKEVDRWEMEFEDLSPRSLEVGSDQSGR